MKVLPSIQRVSRSPMLALTAFGLGCSLLLSPPTWAGVVFDPPHGDAPKDTRGGGSRGDLACFPKADGKRPRFTLLTVPQTKDGWAGTKRPTLVAYSPLSADQQVLFRLSNDLDPVYGASPLMGPQASDLISLSLPETMTPLEVSQSDRWRMALFCAGKLKSTGPFVGGWIQRTTSSSKLIRPAQP